MTFEIYKLEWILSRHTFGNTTYKSDGLGNYSFKLYKSKRLEISEGFVLIKIIILFHEE